MEITAINKRRGHLYEIELSERESVLLDAKTVTDNGLFVGKQLEENELSSLIAESDYTRAFSRAVWYIERGDLSRKALLDKLLRADFSQSAAEKATERLAKLGLIDDVSLAERMAARLTDKNVSTRLALVKMTAKGIDREVAREALEAVECDPQSQIRSVIEKKYKSKLSDPDSVRKVFAALQRLGFGYSDIRAVLKQFSEELQYEEE